MRLETEFVDVSLALLFQTDKAFLVTPDGWRKIWLPKSQVEENPDGTFKIPMWIAADKELI